MQVRLGDRVKAARGRMSREELAVRSGTSLPTIQRIETGKHSPRVETLRRIADALNCTMADLLRDEAS